MNKSLGKDVENHRLTQGSLLTKALRDARIMTKLVAEKPAHQSMVTPKYHEIFVFVDASKEGAGVRYIPL